MAFWREHDRAYRELREEIARDAGHDSYQDAPAAARAAFDGLAQAVILRDSAYLRTVESGGPMTSKGRTRRAADFQQQMDRRAEAWARLVGLKRSPQPTPSLADYIEQRQREAEQAASGTTTAADASGNGQAEVDPDAEQPVEVADAGNRIAERPCNARGDGTAMSPPAPPGSRQGAPVPRDSGGNQR